MEHEFTSEQLRVICAGLLCYRDRMLETVQRDMGTITVRQSTEMLRDARLAQELCEGLWRSGPIELEQPQGEGE